MPHVSIILLAPDAPLNFICLQQNRNACLAWKIVLDAILRPIVLIAILTMLIFKEFAFLAKIIVCYVQNLQPIVKCVLKISIKILYLAIHNAFLVLHIARTAKIRRFVIAVIPVTIK